HFLGHLAEADLISYYQHARAVLFIHEEDFGLVPLEAHAAGTPVIGINKGGITETVIHGQTGMLLDSVTDLKNAILNFDPAQFDREFIKSHVKKFAKDRFQREFKQALVRSYSSWRRRHPSLAPLP
ncbi:MAG: glycosyltransferase, partial [Patescibacteria group bacterium]